MLELPAGLEGVRVLLTNDDGINGEGLRVLERVARTFTDDVWVVAPDSERSAAGHSLTISRPLRIRTLGERRFTIDGTPTDCVLIALNKLVGRDRPTLLLSGVNHGSNIGEDMTYSGTIAAAMEGALLGVPSIALSMHYEKGGPDHWETPLALAPDVIRKITVRPWPDNALVNVNFPARPVNEVTGVHVVRHGKRKIGDDLVERVDPRGKPYIWVGAQYGEADITPDTDVHVVFHGGISITPLRLDLTHRPMMETLRRAFDRPARPDV